MILRRRIFPNGIRILRRNEQHQWRRLCRPAKNGFLIPMPEEKIFRIRSSTMLRSVLRALLRSTSKVSIPVWIFASRVNFVTLMHIRSLRSAITGLRRTGRRHGKSILNASEILLSIYADFDILAMIDGVLRFILTVMKSMNYLLTPMVSSSENLKMHSWFRQYICSK